MRIVRCGIAIVASIALLHAGIGATHAQPVTGRIVGPGSPPMQANALLRDPFISADGSAILFASAATNLSPQFGAFSNVYAYSTGTQGIAIVSRNAISSDAANANCQFPTGSRDGRYVVFESAATNLGPSSTGLQIFHVDRQGGPVQLVSASTGGTPGNDQSRFANVSENGRIVLFQSFANNLLANDDNDRADIFLKNMDNGAVEVISRDVNGAFANDNAGALSAQAMSADTRYAVFPSSAASMITGGSGGLQQIYLRDRSTGMLSRISESAAGVAGNAPSDQAAISANGRYVAFRSFSSNLVSGATSRLFVRDRDANTLIAVALPTGSSVTPALIENAISCRAPRVTDSGDVLMVCDMAAPAAAQLFLWKRAPSSQLLLVSRDVGNASVIGNALSGSLASITPDGGAIAFESQASNLIAGDSNGVADVFFRFAMAPALPIFGNGFE